MRTLIRWVLAMASLTMVSQLALQPLDALPRQQEPPPPPPPSYQGAQAMNSGDGAQAVAVDTIGGRPPAGGGASGSGDGGGQGSGPRCWYEPLRYTTQEEQRTEIRPWEQRPGRWGWQVCEDGAEELTFFPDTPDAPAAPAVDPVTLAESVTITPQVPTIHTSPPPDALHLVNLETWFWVDPAAWAPLSRPATAGSVTVRVTAAPAKLVVDPGDGSPPIQCPGGGTPYDTDLPADAQHSDCTHTYTAPGDYTPTATVVYDVSWTSNVAPGGDLGDITPTAQPFTLQVVEGQAVVVSGTGR